MACSEATALGLTRDCTVSSRVEVADGAGGSTPAWTHPVASHCHITRSSQPHAAEVAERLRGRTAYAVRMPPGAPVALASRIEIDGRAFTAVSDPSRPPGAPTLSVLVVEERL